MRQAGAWLRWRRCGRRSRASRITEPYYPINLAPYVFCDWNVSSDKARAELHFDPTPFEHGAQVTLGMVLGRREFSPAATVDLGDAMKLVSVEQMRNI